MGFMMVVLRQHLPRPFNSAMEVHCANYFQMVLLRRIFSSSLAQPTFPICPNKKPATSSKIGLKEWATERKRMRVSCSGRGRRGADRAQSVGDDSYSSGGEDQCRGARSPYGAALCGVRIARVPVQNAASDNSSRCKSRYGSHDIKRIDHVGRDLRLVCLW